MAGGRDRFGAPRHRRHRCACRRGRDAGGAFMRRLVLALTAIVVLSLVASRSATAGNKFDYCLLCHGASANGNYGIRAPKISGMEPWYLARQLENFATGVRGLPQSDAAGHEMGPVGLR